MLETHVVPGWCWCWCWLVTLLAATLLPPVPFITNIAPYRDTRISTANKEIRSLENGNLFLEALKRGIKQIHFISTVFLSCLTMYAASKVHRTLGH